MSSTAEPTEAVALPNITSDDDEYSEAIELEDRRVAEEFIFREAALLEKKHLFQQHKGNEKKTSVLSGGGEKPNLRPMKAATIVNPPAPECEESSKLSERGIHSLTHSVTDEVSRPISEVEDDPHFDQTEVSSENCVRGSPLSRRPNAGRDFTTEEGENPIQGSREVDDFEGGDGEIDSVNGEKSQKPRFEEQILSPDGTLGQGDGEGEVFQASQELPDDHQPTQKSDSEEFSSIQDDSEEKNTDSSDAEIDDAASNLATLAAELRTQEEESCQQTRLDSEISLFYHQQLEPEDIINPFSLEVRIRKAREQQDISLDWGAETIAENEAGISQLQVNLEDTTGSILPDLKGISPDERTESSERAVASAFHSQVKERIRTVAVPGNVVDDATELSGNKPGVGEAVLLGALASGVNGPTWFVIRAVLVALVASLLLLLHVAIKSGSLFVLLNVLFFISIAGGLILLLGWYVSQIGLVSVDKQMAELNLTTEPQKLESKTL